MPHSNPERTTRTLAVNCSILMPELPVRERLRRVADAGFDAVEFWWLFASAAPDDAEVDAFVTAVDDSGLQLVGLNLFAGDMAAGDRGVLSWPGRRAEIVASAEVAAEIARRLGVARFNALYGNRREGEDDQDAVALDNLEAIAAVVGAAGGTVVLEPLSGIASYPLRTAADVVRVLDGAQERGIRNVGLLLDVYHLATNGDDVAAAIEAHADRVGHAQVADAPGRGAPGTGELPLLEWMGMLRDRGYAGPISFEYVATGSDPFAGLDRAAWEAVS